MESLKHLHPLIDGDIIVYRAGFAADSGRTKWYKENVNADPTKEELAAFLAQEDYMTHALGNTKTCLDDIVVRFDESKAETYLSGTGNFREQAATILPYKGNRDPLHRPKYYREIKKYMESSWAAAVIDGMEADDAMGIRQFGATDDSTIIVSIDKDLDMIPGHHYNFVKKEYYYVDQEYADSRLFWQMLVGDRTDNIPGVDQIGPVNANRICYEECGGDVDKIRDAVKELYQKQYGPDWEGAYFEVGTLLYILRRPEELTEGCPLL